MIIDGGIGGRGLVLRHRIFQLRGYERVLQVWIFGGVIDLQCSCNASVLLFDCTYMIVLYK